MRIIYQMLLKTQNRFFEFFLLKLRNVLSKIYNPNITLKVENFVLTLPFNHNLPFYLKKYPNYDRQLSKIASLIQKISGKLYMIDVGANIGDTITLVNIKQNASFLLIEGDEKYNALIQTNINNNFNTMGGGGA